MPQLRTSSYVSKAFFEKILFIACVLQQVLPQVLYRLDGMTQYVMMTTQKQ